MFIYCFPRSPSSIQAKRVWNSTPEKCWLSYVRVCSLLSCRLIKQSDVNIADQYLQMFKKFELLHMYGSKFCTPNMHLHLHLRECLLDYRPSPSFWCFSFERYNGCLSSIQTNNRSVEQQFMQRFLREQRIRSYPFPNNPEWKELLDTFNLDTIVAWKVFHFPPILWNLPQMLFHVAHFL